MPDIPSAPHHSQATPAPFPSAQIPRHRGQRRFPALRSITALMLREMASRYARTPGGYVWAILEPLAAIIFLSVGFSLVIRAPALGSSFVLFYATGYMPFDLYNNIAAKVAQAVDFSRPLLRFPAVSWIDAIFARFLLNTLTSILVSVLLFTGILSLIDSRTILDLPPILQATAGTVILGLGMGTLNCALIGLFPAWGMIWSIINRPLFLASGIFFLYDEMPPLAQDILWYNPLIHVIGQARTGFFPTYAPNYISMTYVFAVGLILLAFGLLLMGRYHRNILNS